MPRREDSVRELTTVEIKMHAGKATNERRVELDTDRGRVVKRVFVVTRASARLQKQEAGWGREVRGLE